MPGLRKETLPGLVVLMLATCCFAKLLQPAHSITPHPHMCSNSFCSFRFLFQVITTVAEQQIPYGECKQWLLQRLVLQPCMEMMVLGVSSEMPDFDTVFPMMSSFMVNFAITSTSSTPIKSYESTQKLPLLAMRGQVCMRIILCWVLLMMAGKRHLSFGLCEQMFNFSTVSIIAAHSISYQARPSGPRLMGSLRLYAEGQREVLQCKRA